MILNSDMNVLLFLICTTELMLHVMKVWPFLFVRISIYFWEGSYISSTINKLSCEFHITKINKKFSCAFTFCR